MMTATSTTARDGLREKKKARTREALAEAALALFERQGFEATTVDEVAEAAEVSRRTFFRYFPTKEAVLFPARERRLSHFEEVLAGRREAERPFEAVRRACLALAADYVADRATLRRQQRVIDGSPSLVAFERELDRDWETALVAVLAGPGEPGGGLRAKVLAGAVMGAVRAVLQEWFARGAEDDLVALGEQTLSWLEHGFVAAPAVRGPSDGSDER